MKRWRKSSRSQGAGACVEVACVPDTVDVRDSKKPDSGLLTFGDREWAVFVAAIKAGRLS